MVTKQVTKWLQKLKKVTKMRSMTMLFILFLAISCTKKQSKPDDNLRDSIINPDSIFNKKLRAIENTCSL